jgi:hypothetical protein
MQIICKFDSLVKYTKTSNFLIAKITTQLFLPSLLRANKIDENDGEIIRMDEEIFYK